MTFDFPIPLKDYGTKTAFLPEKRKSIDHTGPDSVSLSCPVFIVLCPPCWLVGVNNFPHQSQLTSLTVPL